MTGAVEPAAPRRPTFDEWYIAKYHRTFDQAWQTEGVSIAASMAALSRAVRDYVTEIVARG